ncbi:uncharacterized protein PG986_011246 [Apiospora aurea]|uniref:Uncharacterized protein n=1 Tax=Apiospora aurea TaxID=335848 RepID=A0ABR1Q4K8_9PEZI
MSIPTQARLCNSQSYRGGIAAHFPLRRRSIQFPSAQSHTTLMISPNPISPTANSGATNMRASAAPWRTAQSKSPPEPPDGSRTRCPGRPWRRAAPAASTTGRSSAGRRTRPYCTRSPGRGGRGGCPRGLEPGGGVPPVASGASFVLLNLVFGLVAVLARGRVLRGGGGGGLDEGPADLRVVVLAGPNFDLELPVPGQEAA